MDENQFAEGDTVQLKSGGPVMTVARCGKNYEGKIAVDCQWFEKTKLQQGSFMPGMLKKVSPPGEVTITSVDL